MASLDYERENCVPDRDRTYIAQATLEKINALLGYDVRLGLSQA